MKFHQIPTLLLLFTISAILSSCASKVYSFASKPGNEVARFQSAPPAPAPSPTPSLDQDGFKKLLVLSNDAIGRRALLSELGNCEIRKISSDGCEGEGLYSLYLKGVGGFFPGMSPVADGKCLALAAEDSRSALKEGFCFAVQNYDPFAQATREINSEIYLHKALAGELADCHIKQISSNGCADGSPLYALYLNSRCVYYPKMGPTPDHGGECLARAGEDAKEASDEGLCDSPREPVQVQ